MEIAQTSSQYEGQYLFARRVALMVPNLHFPVDGNTFL